MKGTLGTGKKEEDYVKEERKKKGQARRGEARVTGAKIEGRYSDRYRENGATVTGTKGEQR